MAVGDPKDQSEFPNGTNFAGYNLSVDEENPSGIENQSDLVKVRRIQGTT